MVRAQDLYDVNMADIEPIYQAIGARVRMIRETLGLDQGELAKRIHLNRTSVTNLEAGRQRIRMHTIEQLADALGTSPKNLLKGLWW